MNAHSSASKQTLTLRTQDLRYDYTIPHKEIEYFDIRYRWSPDIPYFVPNCKQIVIDKHRYRRGCRARGVNRAGGKK
jgi:hypothetical protein